MNGKRECVWCAFACLVDSDCCHLLGAWQCIAWYEFTIFECICSEGQVFYDEVVGGLKRPSSVLENHVLAKSL